VESDVRDEPIEQQSEDSEHVRDDRMEDGQSSHIGRGDCNVGGLVTHADSKRVVNEIPIVHQVIQEVLRSGTSNTPDTAITRSFVASKCSCEIKHFPVAQIFRPTRGEHRTGTGY
jgi:hypothetical protein